jgi:colanic acid/amylovoran biosynthesis glycosyltransferase
MAKVEYGTLLLVTPPVTRTVNGVHEVEVDFSNNLRLYLRNFSHVTFAGPVFPDHQARGVILRSVPLDEIPNAGRLSFIPLPYAYREDRYLRYYFATKRLLASEIAKAQYLIFSPHANFEWSTLAARLAIKAKRKFDMESDHDHASAARFYLTMMSAGPKKLRKTILAESFIRTVEACFAKSSLALLQGQEVFDAYKDIAPNPHKVLNVQVSVEDHISADRLKEKLDRLTTGSPLSISYAGQAIERKGPFDWLNALGGIFRAGVKFHATWFGEGPLLSEMKRMAAGLGIGEMVSFPGSVGRSDIMTALQAADIFLFCHKIGESPRCLGEALASGAPLVGYGTEYPRELVSTCGGGEFAEMNDWQRLVDIIVSLDNNRVKLCCLTEGAAASGRLLDRDGAMQNRIDLIKMYLSEQPARS